MPWHDVDTFLNEVCKHVKYKGAHPAISEELKNHIEDHICDFINSGMDEDTAIRKAVEAMGDPEEIGNSLNKLHSPYLGWILSITNILIFIAGFLVALLVISSITMAFDSFNSMPRKEYIKYSINVNEKASMDDRTVVIKEVMVDKGNTLYIRYNDYCKPFSLGWPIIDFKVFDDKGNTYSYGNGQMRTFEQKELYDNMFLFAFDLGTAGFESIKLTGFDRDSNIIYEKQFPE